LPAAACFLLLVKQSCFTAQCVVSHAVLHRAAHAAGLSLRTQELTAAFLLVRLFCSFMMEYDIHTLLDFLTLVATGGAHRNSPRN
jgi:hypothetical protein